jgi:hypothetical protein
MDVAMKILYETNYNIKDMNFINIHYIMEVKRLKKKCSISPYKYEALDFSILKPDIHTYTMYFV